MIHRPFPHYPDFTNFTPVIPELYWNVYSSEERIRALCLEWVKLTAYIDDMADTVNDQYAIIEDMQARLPQLINTQVVAEMRRLINSGEFREILDAAIAEYWDAFEDRIVECENTVSDLSDEVDILRSRNVLVIGDSWSDINSGTVTDGINWVEIWKQIYPGDIVYNFAKGGSGIITGGSSNQNFATQIRNAGRDTSFNNDDIDLILIVGDGNDAISYPNLSSYTTPLKNIINNCATYFPKAKPYLFLASCGRPLTATYYPSVSGTWMDVIYDYLQIERICENELVDYSGGYSYKKLNTFVMPHMFTDMTYYPTSESAKGPRLHLSQYGQWQLFQSIDYCLRTGEEPANYAFLVDSLISDVVPQVGYLRFEAKYTSKKFEAIVDFSFTEEVTIPTNGFYIPLNNERFSKASSLQGTSYCANFDDMFPPITVHGRPAYYITNPTGTSEMYQMGARNVQSLGSNGTAARAASTMTVYMATPALGGNNTHGIVILNRGNDNVIPIGRYVAQMKYDNNTLTYNLIPQF